MPSTPSCHHFVEEIADALRVGAVEKRGVGGDAEAALYGFADAFDGEFVAAFLADGEIVVLVLPIHVHRKAEVFAGLEEMEFFLQQQGVGAEIDVFFARDQPFDDFVDFGMHQRFAAGDGDHRRAAFVHRFEALFRRQVHFQNVRRILNLAAARARQVAAEQRLQHEDQRIAVATGHALLQHIADDRPHLRNRNTHIESIVSFPSGGRASPSERCV